MTKISDHPKLDTMLEEVAAGRPAAHVARDFGVDEQALRRAVRKGGPVVSGRLSVQEGATVEQMVREIVDTLRATDLRGLSPHQRTTHLETTRRAIETLSKVGVPDRKEVTIEDVAGLQEWIGEVFVIAEPYPDIREKMLAALDRHSAAMAGS